MSGRNRDILPRGEGEAVRWAVYDAIARHTDMYEADSVRGPGWYEAECDCDEWRTSGTESVVEDALFEHVHDAHPDWWRPLLLPVDPRDEQ